MTGAFLGIISSEHKNETERTKDVHRNSRIDSHVLSALK